MLYIGSKARIGRAIRAGLTFALAELPFSLRFKP